MPRILIVEDIEMMLSLIEQVVASIPGHKVSGKCLNIAEARLELTRRRPDVVLMDEILPGESSYDFMKELVADGIPVILMTGMVDPSHALPPEALGRIIKPSWESMTEDGKRMGTEIAALLLKRRP
jgi:response regulator of citrate/malate metabolism